MDARDKLDQDDLAQIVLLFQELAKRRDELARPINDTQIDDSNQESLEAS